MATETEAAGYAITINGGLYAYGETTRAALQNFREQIAGATEDMAANMLRRAKVIPLDADAASATAECIEAEATSWTI